MFRTKGYLFIVISFIFAFQVSAYAVEKENSVKSSSSEGHLLKAKKGGLASSYRDHCRAACRIHLETCLKKQSTNTENWANSRSNCNDAFIKSKCSANDTGCIDKNTNRYLDCLDKNSTIPKLGCSEKYIACISHCDDTPECYTNSECGPDAICSSQKKCVSAPACLTSAQCPSDDTYQCVDRHCIKY